MDTEEYYGGTYPSPEECEEESVIEEEYEFDPYDLVCEQSFEEE